MGGLAVTVIALSGVIAAGGRPSGAAPRARLGASGVSWPEQGQGALAIGAARAQASPGQRPVPIASVAKVMTAYVVLRRYPLSGAQAGFTVTITQAQAQDEARDRARGESVVAVRAGEQLTERQLLQALLIPSGNNIAAVLAGYVAGSDPRFLEAMNEQARSLGMDHTTYTDASGFAASTVSTASDQLRLLEQAIRLPVFRQIVAMPSVTLPVAGTLSNFDPLIAAGYVGKTGSDSAAGGCLAFMTHVTVDRRRVTVAGVVLGQGQGSDTAQLLGAAGDAAQQLVRSAVARGRMSRPPAALLRLDRPERRAHMPDRRVRPGPLRAGAGFGELEQVRGQGPASFAHGPGRVGLTLRLALGHARGGAGLEAELEADDRAQDRDDDAEHAGGVLLGGVVPARRSRA